MRQLFAVAWLLLWCTAIGLVARIMWETMLFGWGLLW